MIKRLIVILCIAAVSTTLFAGAVTNTLSSLVPFGDAFKARVSAILDAYATAMNVNTLGTSIPLASNKVFVGSSAGVAVGQDAAQLNAYPSKVIPTSNSAPAFRGQFLIYTASNVVYIGTGLTTNDWVNIGGSP